MSIYIFTEAGCQLLDAIQPEQSKTYLLDCLEYIRRDYQKANVTAHNINFISADGQINYNIANILPEVKKED